MLILNIISTTKIHSKFCMYICFYYFYCHQDYYWVWLLKDESTTPGSCFLFVCLKDTEIESREGDRDIHLQYLLHCSWTFSLQVGIWGFGAQTLVLKHVMYALNCLHHLAYILLIIHKAKKNLLQLNANHLLVSDTTIPVQYAIKQTQILSNILVKVTFKDWQVSSSGKAPAVSPVHPQFNSCFYCTEESLSVVVPSSHPLSLFLKKSAQSSEVPITTREKKLATTRCYLGNKHPMNVLQRVPLNQINSMAQCKHTNSS